MDNCFFSIITVTYNAESFIDKTLFSIIKQSFRDYELIIIDGSSKDNTLLKVNSVSSKFEKIKIISEPDKGIYDAMNKGVKHAIGHFILFLNAGDSLFSEETLSHINKHISSKDAIYYGNAIGVNQDGEQIVYRNGSFSKYRLGYTNICHQTIFYPRSFICNEEFKLKYLIFADWEFNMKLFHKKRFIYINEPIVLYDLEGVSSFSKDKDFEVDQKWIIFKYLGIDVLFYLIFRKLFNLTRVFIKSLK